MITLSKPLRKPVNRALLALAAFCLVALLLLAGFSSREGAAFLTELKAARLDSLRQQAAAAITDYYQGEGGWYACHRLLQKIERLESGG